jgi:hypothetical protein
MIPSRGLLQVVLLLLLSASLAFQAPLTLRLSAQHSRPAQAAAAAAGENEAGDPDELITDAVVHKKYGKKYEAIKHNDDRDSLLYEVYTAAPPRQRIGRFALDPSTGCGDMISTGLGSFVIKRVSCQYR